jgi:hypothetical protein
MHLPASNAYRPALAVAFLICLAWLSLLALGTFEHVPVPPEAKFFLGFLFPLTAATALLYRSALFGEMKQNRRILNLAGVALALLICAGALVLALSLLLFGMGTISPP